jgi:hypothetical protein
MKNQRKELPLAMPVDKEDSLFLATPEQHSRMVEQLRKEFLLKMRSSKKSSSRPSDAMDKEG